MGVFYLRNESVLLQNTQTSTGIGATCHQGKYNYLSYRFTIFGRRAKSVDLINKNYHESRSNKQKLP